MEWSGVRWGGGHRPLSTSKNLSSISCFVGKTRFSKWQIKKTQECYLNFTARTHQKEFQLYQGDPTMARTLGV